MVPTEMIGPNNPKGYKCDQSVHLLDTAILVLQCFVPMTYQRIE